MLYNKLNTTEKILEKTWRALQCDICILGQYQPSLKFHLGQCQHSLTSNRGQCQHPLTTHVGQCQHSLTTYLGQCQHSLTLQLAKWIFNTFREHQRKIATIWPTLKFHTISESWYQANYFIRKCPTPNSASNHVKIGIKKVDSGFDPSCKSHRRFATV